MDLSIIIPVHQDEAGLAKTLDSIKNLDLSGVAAEVIVCNDGGSESISRLAKAFGCREVRLETNRGSYAARNAGVAIAKGSALAFVDADETLSRGWAKQGFEALKIADYVGGRINVVPGVNPSHAKRADSAFAFQVKHYMDRMQFAPTANLFVRRTVFEKVGGFDESLKSGGDREFGVRVFRHGFAQMYGETIVSYHPARDLRAQIKKCLRTAKGTAQLELLLWKLSGWSIVRTNLRATATRICRSILFFARSMISSPEERDGQSLIAWRSAIDAIFHFFLIVFALRIMLTRGPQLTSHIPAIP